MGLLKFILWLEDAEQKIKIVFEKIKIMDNESSDETFKEIRRSLASTLLMSVKTKTLLRDKALKDKEITPRDWSVIQGGQNGKN